MDIRIDLKSPQLEYHPITKSEEKRINQVIRHWGQLKLLMSEIKFLTQIYQESNKVWPTNTIVYIGSAPGYHIPMLMKLFPHFRMILIDPCPFQIPGILTSPTTLTIPTSPTTPTSPTSPTSLGPYLINERATPELLSRLKSLNPILISDLRNVGNNDIENENCVLNDNLLQIDLVNAIDPLYALLKFRCCYIGTDTPTVSGEIHVQCWQGRSSSETRVFYRKTRDKGQIKLINNKIYENQLHYFNRIIRLSSYQQYPILTGNNIIDRSFDAKYHCDILKFYLELFSSSGSSPEIIEKLTSDIEINICSVGSQRTIQLSTYKKSSYISDT